ncbi:MAG: DUF211 domain-containing protein [Acidilobaceae archaeon]
MTVVVEVIVVGHRRSNILKIAKRLSEILKTDLVEIESLESDSDSKSFKVTVEGESVDYEELEEALLELGLTVCEVKKIVIRASSRIKQRGAMIETTDSE